MNIPQDAQVDWWLYVRWTVGILVFLYFVFFRRNRKKQSDAAGRTVHGPPVKKNQKQRQADARNKRKASTDRQIITKRKIRGQQ